MIKVAQVTVDRSYGTKQLLPGLASVPSWKCNVLHSLLVTGYLTTPPRHRPLSLSTYWAWLRYGAAISRRHPGLRLRRGWTDLDPHQKTILSDDFGLGFPCHFLAERHGFEDFADTGYLLDSIFKTSVTYKNKPKRGPAKSPDLIAVDSAWQLHVLECKGTQSTRKYLRTAVADGQAQKRNLKPKTPGFFKSCMVGGIFVPQWRSKEMAELLFIDPEPDPRIRQLETLLPETVASAVRRQSLAKGLAMCGLWGSATAVDGGDLVAEEIARVLQIESGEIAFNGYVEGDLGWRKSVEYRATDNTPEERGAFITELTIDVPRSLTDFIKHTVSSDGRLPSGEVDAWITQQLQMRREENRPRKSARPVGIRADNEPPSAWTFDQDAESDVQASALATLPSGLRFALSLRRIG